MALNLQAERVDAASLGVNLRAIERHVNDCHYVRSFMPGEFVLAGTAAHVLFDAVGLRWPAIEMPDATDSFAAASWRKPSEWRSGHLRVRFWYSSDVGSTSNFSVQVVVDAIRDGEAVPGTNLGTSQIAYAGPAVAFTVKRSAYVYTTTALGSDDELFALRITRVGGAGPDNNTNDMHLLYAEVEHLPAQQVSQ